MISLTRVTKKFGAATALSDVTLTIAAGESCALLGLNGAGKTTLIRLLLDFLTPTAGTVHINGKPCNTPGIRRSIGYLPESLRIPGHLTPVSWLKRHGEIMGMPPDVIRTRSDVVLELVTMAQSRHTPAKACSKGMVQRMGLAAALMHEPLLLILDEPVSGLDPVAIKEFRDILERLKSRGVTILLSSHLLSETEKIATSAAIIHHGKLVLHDTVGRLTNNGRSLEDVFIDSVGKKDGIQ